MWRANSGPGSQPALRETIFRFELVMRINVTTKELLDREELIAALFASQLAMLLSERGGKRPADDSRLSRLELCRSLTLLRVNELLASREARSSVEARYLDGHAALFPDVAAAFEAQLRTSQEVALTAWRAAELDGVEPAPPEDPDAVALRAGQLVADLVEHSRSEALDKLGEGRQALDIKPDAVPVNVSRGLGAERKPCREGYQMGLGEGCAPQRRRASWPAPGSGSSVLFRLGWLGFSPPS